MRFVTVIIQEICPLFCFPKYGNPINSLPSTLPSAFPSVDIQIASKSV